MPLMATKGYAAPEVEKAYTRARELCQQVGETPQLFPVLWGLWVFYDNAGESYRRHMSWRSSCLRLAQSVTRPGSPRASSLRRWGRPCSALESWLRPATHLEQGIALYDPQQHRSLAFLYRA